MPKRKRGESSLEENITKWRKELVRGMKTAKGFERQRLSKRIREADPEKAARLEKEVLVLKSLDLQQAAHAHLCSSLLKIKGVAESPKLPADIKPVLKPELSEEEKTALHNVTSALCNRKQVKDVIEEAIMGTCIALRVPMPDKKNKGKAREKEMETQKPSVGKSKTRKAVIEEVDDEEEDVDSLTDDESDDAEDAGLKRLPLLRRKVENSEGEEDLESRAGSETSESVEFEGFSDSDAEEEMFSKYDGLVGGSSDEDESDEEGSRDDDEDDRADSKAKSLRRPALDDISLSSEASDDEEDNDSDDSEDEALARPAKKARAVKPVSFTTGNSAFLPSLMGGYISGSESASDVDVAPSAKKNRRGQRARQAIWEKKYGEKAKHHQKEKDPRNAGWDMKRGAVEDTSRPWKKGIVNPFEKSHVHPERQKQMQHEDDRPAKGKAARDARQPRQQQQDKSHNFQEDKPKPKPTPKRDDTGPLHPSWAAAKKAKESVQKIEFKGTKVTFD
ncbi:Bud-site selection protein [Xylaria bambusicola]|uniref:Bud-site selection protein n=1 Tax=Xylaria bambusicola TaxID=326684 RepID=UPI0020082433|nr:Bud-site selection protein [Xylaria bambusicola]KAI0518131.1 Bud-site selection protein [Xylaria bambusicola]